MYILQRALDGLPICRVLGRPIATAVAHGRGPGDASPARARLNDGSADATAALVKAQMANYPWLRLIDLAQNGGKAKALNHGLAVARASLVLTVDADSYLFRDALRNIVERYFEDPSRQGGHDMLSLDGSYHVPLAERRSVEVFINRDWVETRNALDNGIDFTFAGAALEQGIGEYVTLVGTAAHQDFSDGNHRNHARLRLIVQPRLDLGLTLQARYRMYTSGTSDIAGAYFNPDRYSEAMLALGWRKRVRGWMTSLTAGLGQQRVAGAAHTPTRLLEVGLQSPPSSKQSVRMHAGVNRSASFGGPDYTYRYAQAEWIVGF